jgi:hypothetical protein
MPATDFLVRLFTALGLGALVGLERQWRQRMAGTGTTALVAAGASAFVMCAFLVRDTSRSEAQIVSYVVSGVGFLGAGVIFKDGGTGPGTEYSRDHLVFRRNRGYLRARQFAVRRVCWGRRTACQPRLAPPGIPFLPLSTSGPGARSHLCLRSGVPARRRSPYTSVTSPGCCTNRTHADRAEERRPRGHGEDEGCGADQGTRAAGPSPGATGCSNAPRPAA